MGRGLGLSSKPLTASLFVRLHMIEELQRCSMSQISHASSITIHYH